MWYLVLLKIHTGLKVTVLIYYRHSRLEGVGGGQEGNKPHKKPNPRLLVRLPRLIK